MAYFTAYFQKKALNFALSQLGLFEQGAFDLDSQNISWGSTTTIELRDVPLSTTRLAELLQLPSYAQLTESRVSLLRLTLPLNFVSNSVAIDIRGVRVKSLISQGPHGDSTQQRNDIRSGLNAGNKAHASTAGYSTEGGSAALPTPEDLAESFLTSQSPGEKARLRAAVASSLRPEEHQNLDDTDNVGLGPDVSIKAFFSNLARGVLDRFNATIKDVQIETTIRVASAVGSRVEYGQTSEEVTFALSVDSIDIPPVSQETTREKVEPVEQKTGLAARHISISGIHGYLLSTSALSSFMTQLSRPASPMLSRTMSKLSDTTSSPELSSRRSTFKDSFRSEYASAVGSSNQSEKSFESLEQSDHFASKGINRTETLPKQAFLQRSLIDDVEDHLPVRFGEDSQAWSESDILENKSTTRALPRLGSDLDQSAMSESSESFLSKSPNQRVNFAKIGSQLSSQKYANLDGASTHSTEPIRDQSGEVPRQDLTESKFFSAAEAKSIYMSALSSEHSPSGIPGSWDTSDSEQQSPESPRDVFHDAVGGEQEHSTMPDLQPRSQSQSGVLPTTHGAFERNVAAFPSQNSSDDDSPPASLLISNYVDEPTEDSPHLSRIQDSPNVPSPQDLPAHKTPAADNTCRMNENLPIALSATIKTLFMIDYIQIQLPPAAAAVVVTDPQSEAPVASTDLPGAFSVHHAADASSPASVENLVGSVQMQPVIKVPPVDVKVAVALSHVIFCFDIALIRLLITITAQFPPASSSANSQDSAAKLSGADVVYELSIRRCILRFEEALRNHPKLSAGVKPDFVHEAFSVHSNDLMRLVIEDLHVSRKTVKSELITEMLVAKFSIGFPDEHVISFDSNLKMRQSVRDILTPSGQDIVMRIVQSRFSTVQLDINTAPLHVNANINRLGEVLSWLGGLSTVLDLGNSVKSNMTITDSPSTRIRDRPRGVHFDVSEPALKLDTPTKPTAKVNLRIGGLAVDIVGKSASILLEGSALKVVFREGAIRTQIDRVNIYGPVLNNKADPAFVLSIDTLAVAYFDLPKENDLTRLLALLSPSHDREEQDDDILLDTLLRQRRKGGVLRVNVTMATARVSQIHSFQHFGVLGEELSQLSSVTKYLPEDDRPGLLVLIALETLQTEFDINQRINSLTASVRNIQLALVTFPSLFLMSVGDIHAKHAGLDLTGQATPDVPQNTARQNLSSEEPPKLSIKFVAGEMEPTVRLKLYNLRFEYHITTVMAFLGISETASGEVIVAEMVHTVANLASAETALGQSLLFQKSDNPSKTQKQFRVDVTIRDTTIGLNPKDKPVHGLLVLTRCRLAAVHAEEQSSNGHGSLEIMKASFMIVDDKHTLLKAEEITDPNIISGLGAKPTQIQCLEAIGYVSVGQISAAKVTASLTESIAGPLLDVEVRNDLLVVETCADSTQTLLSVMGGLSPPMPPRKGTKYRTEVIPIQDMLASFSGHAFPTETDVEDDTDYAASSDDETGTIALDEREDLPIDVAFGSDDRTDVEDSILDPSSRSFALGSVIFGLPSRSARDKNSNVASFQEEAHADSPLHFDDSHFGKAGDKRAKEWNSYKNTYDPVRSIKIKESPLQIRLKDIHFIWHLYDGYDWQKTRDRISQAVEDIEAKAEERRTARREKLRNVEDDDEAETVIGDMLFNSIYIGISPKDDPRELSRRINGVLNDDSSETGSYATTTTISASPSRQGSPRTRKKRLRLGRSKQHKMTFELKGISGNVISFPPSSGETQSSIDIRVQDLEVFDNVPTSTWKKFATYMRDAGNRQLGSSMVHIEMLVVKPDQDLLASEFVLKIDVLPLRLHVDQDALDFLTRFFEFRDEVGGSPSASSEVPFIQRAEVGPIQIKLDFKPKRVDWKALRSGKTAEFMNFVILDEADMVLRKIILYGVRGFDTLGRSLNNIWTPDVRTNQLPGVLAGLAPVRPLVNVGLGVRDLIVVPMREYKKDGRLVRAVRKGVLNFSKTTTTELAKLGAKLAIGTHTMLSGAEGLLAPDTGRSMPHTNDPNLLMNEESPTLSPYADQPIGVVQGLRGAYRGLERDLLMAKDAIVAMPGEVMESHNATGAAAAFLRTAPVVILRPAMGISKAVGQTLMGATNSLDKTERKRIEDKYKHR